jgi:hypothetical protein
MDARVPQRCRPHRAPCRTPGEVTHSLWTAVESNYNSATASMTAVRGSQPVSAPNGSGARGQTGWLSRSAGPLPRIARPSFPTAPVYCPGAGADASVCHSPNSFPCGSLQAENQPMAGTGIGRPGRR